MAVVFYGMLHGPVAEVMERLDSVMAYGEAVELELTRPCKVDPGYWHVRYRAILGEGEQPTTSVRCM